MSNAYTKGKKVKIRALLEKIDERRLMQKIKKQKEREQKAKRRQDVLKSLLKR